MVLFSIATFDLITRTRWLNKDVNYDDVLLSPGYINLHGRMNWIKRIESTKLILGGVEELLNI